jgi:hypothetical protein
MLCIFKTVSFPEKFDDSVFMVSANKEKLRIMLYYWNAEQEERDADINMTLKHETGTSSLIHRVAGFKTALCSVLINTKSTPIAVRGIYHTL